MSHPHSKEPWRPGNGMAGASTVVCDPEGASNRLNGAADVDAYGGHLVGESVCEPDARRICAAVNACVEISTDELEMLARSGKTLTAHGEPRPTTSEEDSFKAFLFGHWTNRPPTVPGLYLAIDEDGERHAVEMTATRIRAAAADDMEGMNRWWWSRPLTLACLTPPSFGAVPREGDGSAREPWMVR